MQSFRSAAVALTCLLLGCYETSFRTDDDRDAGPDGDGDTDIDGDGDGDGRCGDGVCDHPAETPFSCVSDCHALCGDGACTHDEAAATCPTDCAPSCGDAACAAGEDARSCPADCPSACGDGWCTASETAHSCADDCPPICPDSACTHEETAATCPADCPAICPNGACEPGEDSARCPEDCPTNCPDGTCDPGEDVLSCPLDCEAECGDGSCSHDERPWTCGVDCDPACPDGHCTHDETPPTCPADCRGCGDGLCSETEGETTCSCEDDCGLHCGDGHCNCDEHAAICPVDCAAGCGDNLCAADETAETCPWDCAPICGDGVCSHEEETATCALDCPLPCPGITVEADMGCGDANEYLAYPRFSTTEPLLHIVGLYEASGPGGSAVVRLEDTLAPVVLALTSYDPVAWTVDRAPGVELDMVILYGRSPVSIAGVDDVTVVDRSGDFSTYVTYCFPRGAAGDVEALVADAEDVSGASLASFHGCYSTAEITLRHRLVEDCEDPCASRECGIDEWSGTDCGGCPLDQVCSRSGSCFDPDPLAACDWITEETHYCLTTRGDEPELLGLDSGALCSLGLDTGTSLGYEHHSIAWLDDDLFACGGGCEAAGLLRVSLFDGSWDVAPVSCSAVAAYDGGLLVMPSDFISGITFFESFEAALEGRYRAVGVDPWATRFTVHGDTLYAAWHSTNEILVYDLVTATQLPSIFPEGFDTWVWGMAVTDDGLLVLMSYDDSISIFDAATGAWVDEVPLAVSPGDSLQGLACVTNL